MKLTDPELIAHIQNGHRIRRHDWSWTYLSLIFSYEKMRFLLCDERDDTAEPYAIMPSDLLEDWELVY